MFKSINQILHFVLICFTATLVLTYIHYSDRQNDELRNTIEYGTYIITSIWGVLIFIFAVLDNKGHDGKVFFISSYRKLLTRTSFLLITNTIILSCGIFIAIQLSCFRQIEFRVDYTYAPHNFNKTTLIEIYHGNNKIGEISGDEIIKKRIKLGTQSFKYIIKGENIPFSGDEENIDFGFSPQILNIEF